MSFTGLISIGLLATAGVLSAQDAATPVAPPQMEFTVAAGTKVPLSLINSVSTKHSQEGDAVYLKTAFPVLSNGRIVIPVGSYVSGTVTEIKKPGRTKGRGELYVRFDMLLLRNGVTRDFRSRMGTVDASASGNLDRAEGKIKSEGNKGGDARTIGEATGVGASIGSIAGHAAGNTGMGLGVGAGVGAAAGLIGVLVSRGPDAILGQGTTIEMVLDRAIVFKEDEVTFTGDEAPRRSNGIAQPQRPVIREQ